MQPLLPYAADLLSFAARIVVTLLLIFAILLMGREIRRMWTRPILTFGEVSYFDNGTKKDDRSRGIAAEVIDRRNALKSTVMQLIAGNQRLSHPSETNDARIEIEYDQIFTQAELDDLQSAADAVPEIELKIQGNDIGSIVAGLYRWIIPANVVRLSAFKRNEGTEFSINWPNSLVSGYASHFEHAIRGSVTKDEELGQFIGCRILWLELAPSAPQLANTHPDIFCRWSQARRVYDFAEAEFSATGKLSKSTAKITATVEALREIAERIGGFPPLQNVYALLLERSETDDKAQIAHAWENVRRVSQKRKPSVYEPKTHVALAKKNVATSAMRVRPGKSVQIGTSGGVLQVKVTAIVQDEAGTQYLMVPDYAFPPGGSQEVFVPFKIDGTEELLRVGSRSKREIPYPIALVEIGKNITAINLIAGKEVSKTAKAELSRKLMLGGAPTAQAQVIAIDVKSNITSGVGATVLPELIVTTKFGGSGNGGAPVMNSDGALVGMLYASTQETSFVLPVADMLTALNLKLQSAAAKP